MRNVKRVALATFVAAAFAPVAAAQADWFVYHPSDPGWSVLDGGQHKIGSCDAQADGHDTWTRFWTYQSSTWQSTAHDTYGRDRAGRYCTYQDIWWGRVYSFAVCVSYEGCSPWRDITLNP